MAVKQTGNNKKQNTKKSASKKTASNKNNKQKSILETNKPKKKVFDNKVRILTNTGHKLTPYEAKFIQLYVETGNGQKSVLDAGYKSKNPRQYAQLLLSKSYIAEEINFRMEELKKTGIATAEEVMQFYTKVMRGEEKDQFGLDAPLSERIKAGNELAKRLVDIPNKLEGKAQATVTIALNWDGMEESTDEETKEE